MRLATAHLNGVDVPALIDPERGLITADVLGVVATSALDFIEDPALFEKAVAAANDAPDDGFVAVDSVAYSAPYARPHKVWGIGLNYQDHAADLSEQAPDQPASFIKGDHTICGQREQIVIPRQSQRTTVEAELGLVIGKLCRDVSEEDALDYIWGVTTILDQTAEDILRLNPRFLTRSKNFPTFFCFGPQIVPLDEALSQVGTLAEIQVSTVVNETETRSNVVQRMTHSPASLVAFHSQMMPLYPGDIISTGTPGAIVVADGDVVECRIPGIGTLRTRIEQQR